MTATTQGISLKERLLAEFEIRKTGLLLDNPLLDNFRSSSAAAFAASGFPTRKDEEYKYLRFEKLSKAEISVPFTAPELSKSNKAGTTAIPENAIEVSIVNGFPVFNRNGLEFQPEGLEILHLGEAIRNNNKHVISLLGTIVKPGTDPFSALNSAMFMDGIFIHLKKNANLNQALVIHEITEAGSSAFAQNRILLLAEQNSAMQVYHLQTANGTETYANTVVEAELERNAHVTWTCVQDENRDSIHITNSGTHIYSGAVFNHILVSLGGSLCRNNTALVMEEEGSEGHLYGYYHPKGEESIDNHTVVDHRKPNCNSNELYKGVVSGKGTAVFNGKIFVQKDAQKTNAFQSNKNILLSEGASVNTQTSARNLC
ncbi:MAG: SufD family Fe-S cluster assembly protein [Bacteroidia bacterium]